MGANDIRWVNADPNVGADNPNPPWGLTPKYPWLTIQFGVDQLAKIKGGQLNVMVGQYNENVDMRGAQYSNIKLAGQIAAPYTLDQPAEFCEERAVVDGGAKDSVFRIAQATGVLISNLNIQHGKAGLGAGLRIEEAQADIVECCIHDNEATGGGGGGFAYLACDKGQCRVERCLVWSNAARFNGAIAATGSGAGLGGTGGGGLIDGCTDLALEGNRFWDNVAQQQGGGALRIRGSHRVAIEAKGVFRRNKARPDGKNPAEPAGGAILIDDCPDAPASIRIEEENLFTLNEASGDGGAVAIRNSSFVDIRDRNQFRENVTDGSGGAIAIVQRRDVAEPAGDHRPVDVMAENLAGRIVDIADCLFHDNTADHSGGAVHVANSSYLRLQRNRFEKHDIPMTGGAVSGLLNCAIEIRGENRFETNVSLLYGGAIVTVNCHLFIADRNLFEFNHAGSIGGTIAFLAGAGHLPPFLREYLRKSGFDKARLHIVDHNTIQYTRAHDGGGVSASTTPDTPVELRVEDGNKFVLCSATGAGGGLYLSNMDDVVFAGDNEVRDCFAGTTGGGLYIRACKSPSVRNNGLAGFAGNDASVDGGALYFEDCSGMAVAGNAFSGNGKTSGDTLYFDSCKMAGANAASFAAPVNPGLGAGEVVIR